MNAVLVTAPHRSFAASVYALVRFDLRRFRVLAAAVVGLEVSRALFVEWALRLQPVDAIGGFGGAFGTPEATLLDALTWVATVAATVTIVQADLPSDDRAFWRTQPIPPIALALGKVSTLALLLVVAPSIVNAARLAAAGAPLGAVVAASLQIAVLAGAIVVPAWALALVTRTYYIFMVTAAAVITLGFLTLGALVYWDSVFGGRGGLYWLSMAARALGNDWQARHSHGWWTAAAVTLGGLSGLACHYRHRRWTITAALALALLAIRLTVPAGRDWIPAPEPLQRLVAGRIGVTGIRPPSQERLDASRRLSKPLPVPLGVMFTLPSLPRDVSATVITRNNRLIGRDTVEATVAWQWIQLAALGAAVLTDTPPTAEMSVAEGFAVDPAALATLRAPFSLRADAEIRFHRNRLAGELPLRAGSALEVAGERVEVLGVDARPPIALVRYTAFPTLSRRPGSLHLLVADPQRTRIAMSSPGWRLRDGPLAALVTPADPFIGRNWSGRFHLLFANHGPFAPDDRIYVVESRDEGVVQMPLAVDGLTLQASDGR
jgi:hypothetical protein